VTTGTTRRPVAITLVHATACHFCDEAEEVLGELRDQYAIEVTLLHAESAAGAALLAEHRPAMYPLVLVEGAYFSYGRLSRKKLVKHLDALGARAMVGS